MVTLASGADSTPHGHREIAESFGADADRYDRARPRYPAALTDAIMTRLPGRSVLDVGIGTGISAEPLRDRGCSVLGVEPDARMAERARAKGFKVENGTLEDWEPQGRQFDGLVAGQTWHWVDPVAGARKAATVLRPGGLFAVFWNLGRPSAELAAQFAEVFDSVGTGLPFNPYAVQPDADPYGAIIDAAAAGLERTGVFTGVERLSFGWRSTATRDAWLEQASTSGGVNRLPPAVLDALLRRMGQVIDAAGGVVEVEWSTVAAFSVRWSLAG